jgi:hypothetical protein
MSSLAILSGYGSESEEDELINLPEKDGATCGDVPKQGKREDTKVSLPSASILLSQVSKENDPAKKRKSGDGAEFSQAKQRKISLMVPPQIRQERPNIVTEDLSHLKKKPSAS